MRECLPWGGTVSVIQVPGVAEWWDAVAGGHSLTFQAYVADLRSADHEIPPLTDTWTWFAEAPDSSGDR